MMTSSLRLFHWIPRVLAILAILFVSLFALDSFAPGLTVRQQLEAFFNHLVPSFLLLGLLILAWKRELLGGILFLAVGLVFSPMIFQWNYHMNHSIWISLGVVGAITFPFLVVGVLFIMSYRKTRRNRMNK